jgi:hypothetical protein
MDSPLKPLLQALDLAGQVVTADALHTQRETARFLVEDKPQAHCRLGVAPPRSAARPSIRHGTAAFSRLRPLDARTFQRPANHALPITRSTATMPEKAPIWTVQSTSPALDRVGLRSTGATSGHCLVVIQTKGEWRHELLF